MTEPSKDTLKRLFRSRTDRFLAGVCGGLGEYFNIDSNLIRLLFVVLAFMGGAGIILYLAALIIVPENPHQVATARRKSNQTMFWALLLITLGVLLLLRQFGFFYSFHFQQLPWSVIWAIFLIGIGLFLIFSQPRKPEALPESEAGEAEESPTVKIYRSRKDRMLAGVCGGIAHYFNVDASLVRLAWVLASVASIGLGILVYILLIFVFPEEPGEQTA